MLSVCGAPAIAHGQGEGALGVAAGLAPTLADHNRRYETGAHLTVDLEVPRVVERLGLRAEAFVGAFARATLNGAASRRTTVPGASLHVVVPLADASAFVQPYVMVGAGTYRTDLGGGPPAVHFGRSWGGGVLLHRARVSPYAELRVLRVYDGGTPRLVPFSVGVRL